jgi:2,3-bisphosphoglycerate-dependent phosphoglycerate mutase
MQTRLIIARHGNTFEAGEIVRRVGGHTDIPLSNSGKEQAKKLGLYLKKMGWLPDQIFCSELLRTQQTAALALAAAHFDRPIQTRTLFNELDYGIDENQPESTVIARLGQTALDDWEKNTIVPSGWNIHPASIIAAWKNFAAEIIEHYSGQTILIVTSNGVARFAPHITDNFASFLSDHKPKLATGAFGIMLHTPVTGWAVKRWNQRPE